MKNPPKILAGRETPGRLKKQKCLNPAASKTPRASQRGCCFTQPCWSNPGLMSSHDRASTLSSQPASRLKQSQSEGCPILGSPFQRPFANPANHAGCVVRLLLSQCVYARQRSLFSLNTRYHCSTWNTSKTSKYITTCRACMERNLLGWRGPGLTVWKCLHLVTSGGMTLDFAASTPPPLLLRIPSPRGAPAQ